MTQFLFADPTGGDRLAQEGVLDNYRAQIQQIERSIASDGNTLCTPRQRFEQAQPGTVSRATVTWTGYPLLAAAANGNEAIDRDRDLQDEYVEWDARRDADGHLSEIIFTTEFSNYFAHLASAGVESLARGIRDLYPDVVPSASELFGAGFDPAQANPRERAERFLGHLPSNPWNNGGKGILCLGQRTNTLGALYGLIGPCSVPRPGTDPADTCGTVMADGACVVGRSSDPRVCQACQGLAQASNALCLDDPVGVRITELSGEWEMNGAPFDINDLANNRGVWSLHRNGRRGILTIVPGLTLNGAPVTTGAQVAPNLFVGADVLTAPVTAL